MSGLFDEDEFSRLSPEENVETGKKNGNGGFIGGDKNKFSEAADKNAKNVDVGKNRNKKKKNKPAGDDEKLAKADKIIKKNRRRKKRRIILLSLLGVILAAVLITWFGFVRPIYKEARAEVFEVLCGLEEDTFLMSGSTSVYDVDGTLICSVGNEDYEYVEISDVSTYVINGYIAKEDKTFLDHNGISIKGITRAGLAYVKSKLFGDGTITQGGSTITQQVVKNVLLSSEKTFVRKAAEAMLAVKLEQMYDKYEIMEIYCNSIFYGNGCYGIQAASRYYFDKDAGELTLAEAAMLVATTNAPSLYNPVADYETCMEEKTEVLDAMLECEFISEEEYEAALAEEPEVYQVTTITDNQDYLVTYALDAATKALMEYNGFEFQYEFLTSSSYTTYTAEYEEVYAETYETLRSGGYSVYTSLDPDIQELLQESIDSEFATFTEKGEDGMYELQAAGVVVDNSTGLVVAAVGGREEIGEYNRAYQAERQPGSSIKPLLDYAPAFNEGVITTPSDVYVDEEIDINGYSPKNSGGTYHGSVTLRTALLYSYNTVAVQLLYNTGLENCLSYLSDMKFSSLAYADWTAYATAIGGFTNGVTVSDMAKGYATLANGGKYVDETCILLMTDYAGNTISEYEGETVEVYDEDTAFMVTDMLEATFQESGGAGYKYQTSDQVYAGKTGTTNDSKDAWFCGYSQYYTCAIWMGYDTPTAMGGVYGSTYPAECWTTFMEALHEELELEPAEFEAPDTVVLQNISDSGDRQQVSYTENVYKSRPDGYDYVSLNLEEKAEEYAAELAEEAYLSQTTAAVEEFEAYEITTAEDVESYEKHYNEVYSAVLEISDSETRAALLERIAYKFELLEDEAESWASTFEAAAEAAQEQTDAENLLNSQASSEEAEETLVETRIELVEWFIDTLNSRTVYTDYVEDLISAAKSALADCSEYSEYDDLDDDLADAISYARGLMTKAEVQAAIKEAEEAKEAAEAAAAAAAEEEEELTTSLEEAETAAEAASSGTSTGTSASNTTSGRITTE